MAKNQESESKQEPKVVQVDYEQKQKDGNIKADVTFDDGTVKTGESDVRVLTPASKSEAVRRAKNS